MSKPRDACGVVLSKGDRVLVRLAEPYLVMKVMDVEEAADVKAPNGQPMPTRGTFTLAAPALMLEYSSEAIPSNIFVLKDDALIQEVGLSTVPPPARQRSN